MVKKQKVGTKNPERVTDSDRFPRIEQALRQRTKANIVELILRLAKVHASLARDLEQELAIEKPVNLLVGDISSAIDRATDFDERQMNDNFDVDWQAYEEVGEGLKKLIELGQLEDAKSLALKLMQDGSYQVECSDEGLMTDDIQDCLRPVIQAVQSAGGKEAAKWALKMLSADRVGFICDKELNTLAGQT